ncbi:hypothetical protein MC7420_4232 [Coleofasciculus chthonoplastes PCC 7420]|uniref:Uncharacterized protein n=1 Tax=Coleofasciculus chthonoplastes PCC 7420 TaxID=118168 RepID=B4VUX7_9CYAN|nr:hypothetical protein MC7420_4232 [Coleofasciculus chthonoplastes PCC 7420]
MGLNPRRLVRLMLSSSDAELFAKFGANEFWHGFDYLTQLR